MNSLACGNDDANDKVIDTPTKSSGPSYPELCLRDDQVKAFLDGARIEPGKEYEATIKFKMTGWRESPYGKSLDLAILEGGDVVEEGEAESKTAGEEDDSKDPVMKAASYG
jgi:hypothetical protein